MSTLKTKFEKIVDVQKIGTSESGIDLGRIMLLADSEEKNPASKDVDRVELMFIDNQVDFISPQGNLPVDGAVEDTERLCRFIYKHMYNINRIRYTLDWHSSSHIFFPNAWVYGKDFSDVNGDHKAGEIVLPGVTVITTDGISQGMFKTTLPNMNKAYTYVKKVEEAGDELRIWPYHCLANSRGASLDGELNNIVTFHSKIRKVNPMAYYKGQDQYSEQYGAMWAEYSPQNTKRLDILNVFEDPSLTRIYLAGQAKSHCFLRTLQQAVIHFANRTDILRKIYVLEDCMSCIAGFEQITEQKMEEIKKLGVNFVKSTDVTDLLYA